MAKTNNKGNRNNGANAGGKKPALPRINAKIDRLADNDTNLRAFASITVGGAVAVHGLRVMDSKKGLFVSMPSYSYEDRNGESSMEKSISNSVSLSLQKKRKKSENGYAVRIRTVLEKGSNRDLSKPRTVTFMYLCGTPAMITLSTMRMR